MNNYENKAAENWTLADECAGLEKEEGILITACPVMKNGKDAKARADACQDYMAILFAGWCMANGGRKLYEIDDTKAYAIFEKGYFSSLSKTMQKLNKKKYGKFCIIVPDFFFDWVNVWKYKLQTSPTSQLWIDECGDGYRIDSNRGEGYMLTRVGQDKVQGTTADYWLMDKKDVMLKAAVDRFAEKIGKAMDSIPTLAKEKRGPGRPPKDKEEPKEGTPEFIAQERDKVMMYYREILEKRYVSLAGYDRNRVVERIKEKMMVASVTMNDLQRTGSLVPMQNGLFDLRTREFRSARPDDYICAWAPTTYDPNAKDECVEKFLNQFTCDREDLKDFLAQVLGVGLDLNMLTRTLCELWGESTTNGKSTIVKALVACLGKGEKHGLAQELPPTVIGMSVNSNDDSRTTPSLAMIGHSRILFASEPKKGMKVDWALVKRLCGGDIVSVNQKFKDLYNIDARALMVLDTNHSLKVDDHTLFARGTIQVVPCDFQVTEDIKDNEIDRKLSTESAKSTWMNFMLTGHQSYVKNGKRFSNPPCVQGALAKNKEQSDRIGCFVKENYIQGNDYGKKVAMRPMWKEYVDWCTNNGDQHTENYTNFCKYFESRSNYIKGSIHDQKALCGLVHLQSAIEAQPIITGDPVDWFIGEYMVEDAPDGGQQVDFEDNPVEPQTVKLEVIYREYRQKVIDAGEQPLELRQLYGELVFRGWNVSMGTPGDTSSIIVTGWHLAGKAEMRAKEEAKRKARVSALQEEVRLALGTVKNPVVADALDVIMKAGLNTILKDVTGKARTVIEEAVKTGFPLENIILTNAF